MSTAAINPIYKITEREGTFGIAGTEMSTGEYVEIKPFTKDKFLADELTKKLNCGKVSLCHAKDVVLDEIIKELL